VHLDPAELSIGAVDPALELPVPSHLEGLFEPPPDTLPVVRVDVVEENLIVPFVERSIVPEDLVVAERPFRPVVLQVEVPGADAGRIQGEAQSLIALFERLLQGNSLRDVLGVVEDVGNRPIVTHDRGVDRLPVALLPVTPLTVWAPDVVAEDGKLVGPTRPGHALEGALDRPGARTLRPIRIVREHLEDAAPRDLLPPPPHPGEIAVGRGDDGEVGLGGQDEIRPGRGLEEEPEIGLLALSGGADFRIVEGWLPLGHQSCCTDRASAGRSEPTYFFTSARTVRGSTGLPRKSTHPASAALRRSSC